MLYLSGLFSTFGYDIVSFIFCQTEKLPLFPKGKTILFDFPELFAKTP